MIVSENIMMAKRKYERGKMVYLLVFISVAAMTTARTNRPTDGSWLCEGLERVSGRE